jgi:hypothetical protein
MTVLDEIDQLYETAVTSPASVNDQMIQDWADGVAVSYQFDRLGAKYVRRCLNIARKLAVFWLGRTSAEDNPVEWHSRVDLALGVRAWRPQLDLARHLLVIAPDHAIYDKTGELFRIVNNEPFLDGMSYEVWLETSHA